MEKVVIDVELKTQSAINNAEDLQDSIQEQERLQ